VGRKDSGVGMRRVRYDPNDTLHETTKPERSLYAESSVGSDIHFEVILLHN
jgi:hypothetical protein